MRGIQTPPRGRPSKVTKPSTGGSRNNRTQGRRPNGSPDNLQDPTTTDFDEAQTHHDDLEAAAAAADELTAAAEEAHQIKDDDDTTSVLDPQVAAAAAAAAHAHHQQQQQQQQEEEDQQHQHQQLDLTAASILASSVQNEHHHPDLSAPPHAHHNQPGAEDHTSTESYAQQSGYASFVVESALAKRLAREPGMRFAQQRRPEQALNLNRRSNVEALFAHIAGDSAAVPCKNCHKGHGPWTTCVVVDGQMCGSCANCWFNASGARCSFHETRNPQAHTGGGPAAVGMDGMGFQMPSVPQSAMAPFNFASIPASTDPVVRFTVERAMAEMRSADKKTRSMLLVETAAKQLAFHIAQYEDAIQEEQDQQQAQQQQQQHNQVQQQHNQVQQQQHHNQVQQLQQHPSHTSPGSAPPAVMDEDPTAAAEP